jgi:long-chain acyl-CoA synthetase
MMPIRTIPELFLLIASRDQPDCLLHKVDGRFVPISSTELADSVYRLAAALVASGIKAGDRIALMADNGPHWPIVDFATLSTGAILVPIYPTLTPEQAAYIANDCGARIVLVEGYERLQALLSQASAMPAVERFILIGESPDLGNETETLADLIAGAEADPESFEARARSVDEQDLATFIYTSGTTGKPKGVMLTHGNLASNVEAAVSILGLSSDFTALSFLPLSHSFERTVDYCYFLAGITIAYAESVKTISTDLGLVQPHVFVSVPRIYEKVLAGVLEKVARGSAVNRAIFGWAQRIGARALSYRLAGTTPTGLLGLQLRIADALVFSKIKGALGGRFEFAISGGAPLSSEVAEFFWAAGVRIFEGYGLSETSPVLTLNHHRSVRLGTVGAPIPGVELRIADDGEILARGPSIMRGYYNLDQATAEALGSDGWFHTGDIGEIDDSGHLRITDRKKELIVNAYGKNIAPAPIEGSLKSSRYIEHAVVIGDKRRFLSALLVPDFAALEAWAEKSSIAFPDRRALVADRRVHQLIEGEVAGVNRKLSRYQRIRAWELLPDEFSIEGGELTPTQKVKRRVVRDRYAQRIERLYSTEEAERTDRTH